MTRYTYTDTLSHLDLDDILSGFARDDKTCLKAQSDVWRIRTQNDKDYVVKFMPFEEAKQHVLNAELSNLVNVKSVDCIAFQYDADTPSLPELNLGRSDGMLVMPLVHGMPLCKYKKTMDSEDRTYFYESMKNYFLPGMIMAGLTDPNDENTFVEEAEDDRDITFIDPAEGIASVEEMPVDVQYETLTTNVKRFPHLTHEHYDEDELKANTYDLITKLKNLSPSEISLEARDYVDKMIERGREFTDYLGKNKNRKLTKF